METGKIVQIFAKEGYQLDPGALDILKNEASEELIRDVLDSIDSSVFVVGAEHIAEHMGSLDYASRHPLKTSEPLEPVIVPQIIRDEINVSAVVKPQEPEFSQQPERLQDMELQEVSPYEAIRKLEIPNGPEVQALPIIEAITESSQYLRKNDFKLDVKK